MGRRVWFHEIFAFLFRDRARRRDLSVAQFMGASQDGEEEAMAVTARARSPERSLEHVG
jgi:anaerobic magnesium-protoporphyrin IX monomethyl ester cyclase